MPVFTIRFGALVTCAVVAAASSVVLAQRPSSTVPDITGSWQRWGAGLGPRPTNAKDPTVPPPAPPPLLKEPHRTEWQAKMQAIREADAKGQPLATNYTHCIPDGMPTMMAAIFPLEILQSRGQITIIEEAYTQVRRILMERPQKPVDEVEPGFYGHSVGRWEGDTLVVDTVGIKDYVRYQNVPHTKDMRIRERMKLVASDVLWNEITIEDPAILEKPWTFTYAYKRMPDYTLLEYICEDNREYADEQGRQQIRVGSPSK